MLILLAAAASAAQPTEAEKRFNACIELVDTAPEKAISYANDWRLKGGELLARQCLGLAYAAQQRWLPAMTAFEQAAQAAENLRDARAANFWVQAGNAALAANQAAKARSSFDAALASGVLKGQAAGEAHLDRAWALASIGDVRAARTDLDVALKLVPADPLGWLLSATLARKMGEMDRASVDIEQAAKLSPDDAAVALEAGNIALLMGSEAGARTAWQAAIKNAPSSEAAKLASAALSRLGAAPKP